MAVTETRNISKRPLQGMRVAGVVRGGGGVPCDRLDMFRVVGLTFQSLLVACTNQFNIQQLYALSTLHLWVLCLSENKQRLVPITAVFLNLSENAAR